MTEEKKVSCVRCKSLWIGLVIAIIGITLIAIAIFNMEFYSINYHIITDLLRFGFLGLVLAGSLFASQYSIRKFCFDKTEHGNLEYLAWGIGLTIVSSAFLMLLIYFLPIAIDETELRMYEIETSSYEWTKQVELMIEKISKLSCGTFYWNYQDWSNSFTVDIDLTHKASYSGDKIQEKWNQCK